jgi:hypothetical protein
MNVGNSDQVMGQTIQVQFLVSTKDFPLLQNIKTDSGAQTSLILNVYQQLFPLQKSGQGVRKLTAHLHLLLMLGIRAATPLLPICAIITCTTNLYLYLH